MNKTLLSSIFALVLISNHLGAQTVVYSDNFSGTGQLSNRQVEISASNASTFGGTTGAMWQSVNPTSFNEGGGTLNYNQNKNQAISLPFIPQSGSRYTITANVTHFVINPLATSSWVGISLATDAAGSNAAPSDDSVLMYLSKGATGTLAYNRGRVGGTGGTLQETNYTTTSGTTETAKYSFVLNTEAPAWTVSFFVNDLQLGTTQSFTSNPNIQSVNLAGHSSSVSFDNFSLVAIPEPQYYLIMMIGFIGFVFYRKSGLKNSI